MSFGPADFGFDLLPPDPGVINPDLALDSALVEAVDFEEEQPLPLGKGWQFNFETGQFVKHGAGPMAAYNADNLAVWIQKACITARFAHPIYTDDFGVDEPYGLIGQVSTEASLSGYEQEIERALLVHDQIIAVENFDFSQTPGDDALWVSFDVLLDATSPLTPTSIQFTNVQVVR